MTIEQAPLLTEDRAERRPAASAHRVCGRCVMDTTASEIEFDEHGICSFCTAYLRKMPRHVHPHGTPTDTLETIVAAIKRAGRKRSYDCVLGVSGGVDSSYLAYQAAQLGLRTLAVHFDNGWDSEVAVANLERVLTKLGHDYETYVVDWDEFRDLQLAFLRASVPNVEIPTDHGLLAALYRTCRRYRVKYLLTGSNFATEGILPQSWAYNAKDLRHLRAIHRRFGSGRLRTFPRLGYGREIAFTYLWRIRRVRLLEHMAYEKEEALRVLQDELGWVDYGGKHFESVFTRFFQAYILPTKFGIDKRKAHLSTLICSGQITREQALDELERPLYEPDRLREDTEYVLKKLRLDPQEFGEIMSTPPVRYGAYPNAERVLRVAYRAYDLVRR